MKTTITYKAFATMKSMTTALALGLTALTLTGTAVAEDRHNHSAEQTRPYFSRSHVEVKITPVFTPEWELDFTVPWEWTAVGEGNATGLGRFTSKKVI